MSKPAAKEPERLPLDVIMKKAGKRALGGGIPGAVAMGAQVATLMPLRTTMNVSLACRDHTGAASAILRVLADLDEFWTLGLVHSIRDAASTSYLISSFVSPLRAASRCVL